MTVLSPAENFLGIPEENSAYDTSRFVVLSIPYEHSVSYGRGAGLAPAAMLAASHYVEFWDEEFGSELCFSQGICTIEPLDLRGAVDADAMKVISDFVGPFIADDKFLVTLGGEHSLSAPIIHQHLKRHPGMSVLQFDAHSDLRQEYLGNPHSHASAMARALDVLPPSRLVQLGIRAQCIEEFRFIQKHRTHTFFAHDMHETMRHGGFEESVAACLTDEVYITFDLDFFDPSIMPTTGTPEPGGFLWDETMRIIKHVAATRRIIGCDIVELAPDPDFVAPTYLATKLAYKIMNAASR